MAKGAPAAGNATNSPGATNSGALTTDPVTGAPIANPAPNPTPGLRPGASQVPSPGNAAPSSPITSQVGGSPTPGQTAQANRPLGGGTPPVDPNAPGQPITPATTPTTNLSSGGSSRTGTDANSGAAGKNLADCMAVWEPATHMTKTEWRRTCERTLQEYPSIQR
jgi:hypothetical protein